MKNIIHLNFLIFWGLSKTLHIFYALLSMWRRRRRSLKLSLFSYVENRKIGKSPRKFSTFFRVSKENSKRKFTLNFTSLFTFVFFILKYHHENVEMFSSFWSKSRFSSLRKIGKNWEKIVKKFFRFDF